MVSEEETRRIRRFVCGQLRDESNLSTLTLGILKKRYLARVGCESLSQEAKNFMKQMVRETLMKMQKQQNKRKREEEEKENDNVTSGEEDESKAKKSRCLSSSSSESEDKEDCKSGSEKSEEEEQRKSGSENEEQVVKTSQRKTNGNRKNQMDSEDSADEEIDESKKEESKGNCSDGEKETVEKKESTKKSEVTGSNDTSQGKKTPQSDEENDSDTDNMSERSEKINGNDSSDDGEKEEKVLMEKKNDDSDSDSSSLSSLEEEQKKGPEKTQGEKKKKTMKKEKSTRVPKDFEKTVARLKRYIALCGVKRQYKKLLQDCRSVHQQVAVLKKELKDLGVHGQPSVKKCKTIREKREEAQELAALDVSNIIPKEGRPRRRASLQKQRNPPSSTYLRTLNSDSDSDEQNNRHRRTDWSNLQGIISDDADSN